MEMIKNTAIMCVTLIGFVAFLVGTVIIFSIIIDAVPKAFRLVAKRLKERDERKADEKTQALEARLKRQSKTINRQRAKIRELEAQNKYLLRLMNAPTIEEVSERIYKPENSIFSKPIERSINK